MKLLQEIKQSDIYIFLDNKEDVANKSSEGRPLINMKFKRVLNTGKSITISHWAKIDLDKQYCHIDKLSAKAFINMIRTDLYLTNS